MAPSMSKMAASALLIASAAAQQSAIEGWTYAGCVEADTATFPVAGTLESLTGSSLAIVRDAASYGNDAEGVEAKYEIVDDEECEGSYSTAFGLYERDPVDDASPPAPGHGDGEYEEGDDEDDEDDEDCDSDDDDDDDDVPGYPEGPSATSGTPSSAVSSADPASSTADVPSSSAVVSED
ncbi:hypothetical protein IMZ48_30410, partial [Candidatus Bathyarchaeota archaeon]|nr:hypothetical protein [Candidatus Bathyarchaeota archaeon]